MDGRHADVDLRFIAPFEQDAAVHLGDDAASLQFLQIAPQRLQRNIEFFKQIVDRRILLLRQIQFDFI